MTYEELLAELKKPENELNVVGFLFGVEVAEACLLSRDEAALQVLTVLARKERRNAEAFRQVAERADNGNQHRADMAMVGRYEARANRYDLLAERYRREMTAAAVNRPAGGGE